MKRKECIVLMIIMVLLVGLIPQPVQAATIGINLATVNTGGTGYTCTTTSVSGETEYIVTIKDNGTYSLTGTIHQVSDYQTHPSHPTHVVVTAANADIILEGVDVSLLNFSPIEVRAGSQVNLILADGTINTLSAAGTAGCPGLYAIQGSTVTISGNGALHAVGGSNAQGNGGAGIGGRDFVNPGTIIIDGGTIYATGGSGTAGVGGNHGSGTVIINGGVVTATGGAYAPGIGGHGIVERKNEITINDGTVTATGGYQGAGIGGTAFGTTDITIYGGNIHATGGAFGAGIGSGDRANGTVTIHGGIIKAIAGEQAAGIGGGEQGNGTVIIDGGLINATSGGYAAGIGGGARGAGNVTISGGTITAIRMGAFGSGIGEGHASAGSSIVVVSGGSVNATNIVPQPTSNGVTPVNKTTVTLTDSSANLLANTAFTCTLQDGTSFPVVTDNAGKVYLWLPAAAYTTIAFTSGGETYSVSGPVTSSSTNNMSTIITVTSVQVKNPPAKTNYKDGDGLTLSGLVLTLNKSNGTSEDVAFTDFAAKGITTDLVDASVLTTSNASIKITYTADNKSVYQVIHVSPVVTSVQVKNSPAKTNYKDGDGLTLTGLVVSLNKSNGTSEDVVLSDFAAKGITTDPVDASVLTTSNASIKITYTADNKSVYQAIHVSPVVTSVQVKNPPTKTNYKDGDGLTLTGLVVSLNKSNGTSEDVAFTDFAAKGITTDPVDASVLTTSNASIKITYTADNKSVYQAIHVSTTPSSTPSTTPSTTPSQNNSDTSNGDNQKDDSTDKEPNVKTDQPTIASVIVTAKVNAKGKATALISKNIVSGAAIEAEKANKEGESKNGIGVRVLIDNTKKAKSLSVLLTSPALNVMNTSKLQRFDIDCGLCDFSLDSEAVKEIKKQSKGNVTFSVVPVAKLNKAASKLIGSRPVYRIAISYVVKGKTYYITSIGKGKITLSLPYEPKKKEVKEYLYAVSINEKGKVVPVKRSVYDTDSKSVIFTNSNLSTYGVAYKVPTTK